MILKKHLLFKGWIKCLEIKHFFLSNFDSLLFFHYYFMLSFIGLKYHESDPYDLWALLFLNITTAKCLYKPDSFV